MVQNKSYCQMDQATTVSFTESTTDSIPFRSNRRSRHVASTYTPNHRFSRYNNTLWSMLPFRLKQTDELSVQNSGLFSGMTFHWIYKYLWQSINNNISLSIPLCPQSESCHTNSPRLIGLFDDQSVIQGQNNLSIFSVVFKFIRTRTLFASILYILGSLMSMIGLIYFLPRILTVDEDKQFGWMFALVFTELISAFLSSCSNAINLRTAIRLRSACFSSLFRQGMITSLTYKLSSWQLTSFLLSDGQHIQDMVMAFPNLICTPVIFILCMIFTGVHLGLWGYLSVIVIIILFPIFILIAFLSKNLLHKATFFSNQRIKLMEDFISHNIYVKYFKQEYWFENNIAAKRNNEVQNMKKAGLYDNICFSLIFLQPFLSLTALYIAYNNKMDLAKFAAISIILLIHMKQSLDNFWQALSNFIKGLAALSKFKKLIICDTVNFNNKKPKESNISIRIEEANFQWTKQVTLDIKNSTANIFCTPSSNFISLGNKIPTHDILHDINMIVEKGKLVGICGLPGSGKTSILLAVMGLLLQSKGKSRTTGHYAYANQDPVIFPDTFKNNILFGNELDSKRYFRVTMYCELQEFISTLPEQDDTVIESKFLTLELKQRIAVARAMYENGEIYLFDEPFSAIESRKAAKIFDNCIIQSLRDKTILLVTDNIEFLQQCDEIFMMQHGKILAQGEHQKLINYNSDYIEFMEYLLKQKSACRENYDFVEVAKTFPSNSCDTRLRSYSTICNIFGSTDSLSDDQIDTFEKSKSQKEDNNILKFYFLHFGFCSIIILFLMQILNVSIISFLPVYFIYSLEEKNLQFLFIYLGIFLWMLIFGVGLNYFFTIKMFSASIRIHNEILQKIYKATLEFFQAKSLSIISVISIQQQLTDMEIPRLIHNIFVNLLIAIITSSVIFFSSLWYILPAIAIFTLMILCTAFIRRALLPFNQFGMDCTDILYTQVITMLNARPVIQAYKKINFYYESLCSNYDKYIVYLYIVHAAKGWLLFILQCLTVLLLASIGFMSLLSKNHTAQCLTIYNSTYSETINNTNDNTENLSCIALAIVCTLQACYALQKALSLYLNAGLAFDILSKVQTFKMSITEEEPEGEEIEKYILEDKAHGIKFMGVTVDSDVAMINDMTFRVLENEKMGFYGLTSLERKSIIALLYKLTHLSHGKIMIGKSNLSKIAVRNLRSLVSIIPVEPYLFNSTIKKILTTNSDLPINLIEILKKFLLIQKVSSLPNKIDAIADHLLNTEEKQLLCLAQAYIKQSPIVIIEDFVNGSSMEYLISSQIKELFPQSTVLIFANDIGSLHNCDSISVFQEGKLVTCNNAKNVTANYSPQLAVFETSVHETDF